MNNLREFYERALEVFGTSDEGELDSIVLQFKKKQLSTGQIERRLVCMIFFVLLLKRFHSAKQRRSTPSHQRLQLLTLNNFEVEQIPHCLQQDKTNDKGRGLRGVSCVRSADTP